MSAARCTIHKLKYLSRVISCDDQDNVTRRALSSLADNVEALSIVSECRELEERYCTDYTSSLLFAKREDGTSILKQMEERIKRKYATLLLESAQVYMLRPDSQPDPLRSGQPASKPADRLQSRLTGLQPLVAPQPALKPGKFSVSAYRPAS